MLQVCGRQPNVHTLTNMLDCVGQNDFGVIVVLALQKSRGSTSGQRVDGEKTDMQSGGFPPNVFALWALLASSLDELSRSHHPSSVLFQACSCNPTWRVLWI